MDTNEEKKKSKFHLEAPFVILIVLAALSLISRIYLLTR
jgi:hypothetical protein